MAVIQLTAPDDLSIGSSFKYSGGGGAQPVTWGVGNPLAAELAGLSKEVERFAATYDDVQINDYLLKTQQEFSHQYEDPDTGLFNTRKRDKSKGLFNEYEEAARKKWHEEAPQVLNERQMAKAEKTFGKFFHVWGRNVATHETSEMMNYQVDQANTSILNASDIIASGNFSDETLGLAVNSVNIASDAFAKMQGWDAETAAAKKRESLGKAFEKGIEALAVTDPMQAIGVLKEYEELIPEVRRKAILGVLDGKAETMVMERAREMAQSGDIAGARNFLTERAGKLPRGVRNNSPGNVTDASGSYKKFGNMADGFNASAERLLAYQRDAKWGNADTLAKMMNIYAPRSDGNDPDAYAKRIARETGIGVNQPIDLKTSPELLEKVVGVIAKHENANYVFDQNDIKQGVADALAGKKPKVVGHDPRKASGGASSEPERQYVPGTGMLRPSKYAAGVSAIDEVEKKQITREDKTYGLLLANSVRDEDLKIDDALARIRKNYANDPIRMNAAQDAFMEQIRVDNSALEATEKRERLAGLEKANRVIESKDFNIQKLNDLLLDASPKNVARIKQLGERELVKRKLLSPTREVNDPVAYQRAKQAVIANTPIEEVMAKYGTSLSSVKEEDLHTLAQSQERKNAERQDNAYIDYYIKQSGIDTKPGTKGERFIAELKMRYADWLVTPGEKNAAAREAWWYENLARRSKSGFILDSHWSANESGYEEGPNPPSETELKEIRQYLEKRDLPETPENIEKARGIILNAWGIKRRAPLDDPLQKWGGE
ncbi:MAG: hypothetical protein LBB60_10610 [Desulfovibrio sp.]|jgi:hypothetical protein|nr:hypothetical protein [Desulfovibrio sp.]